MMFAMAVSPVACSLLLDTGGLGGQTASADAASAPDAGFQGDVDATQRPGDAGLDDGSDGAASFQCTSNALVCSDFESGDPLATGWTNVLTTGGRVSLVTTAFAGRGAAQVFVEPVTDPASDTTARLEKVLSGWVPVQIDAELFLDGSVTTKPIALVTLLYPSEGMIRTGSLIFIDSTTASVSVEHVVPADRYKSIPPLPRNRWFHLRMAFTPTGKLEVQVDTDAVQRFTFPAVAQLGGNSSTLISLGFLAFTDVLERQVMRVDNVQIKSL
jgi:hypothetical protein